VFTEGTQRKEMKIYRGQVNFDLYNLNQFNTRFLYGPHYSDRFYGPRRTSSINKCARFICCKTTKKLWKIFWKIWTL